MMRFRMPLIPLYSFASSSDTHRSRAMRRSVSSQRRDESQLALGSGTDSPNQVINPSSSFVTTPSDATYSAWLMSIRNRVIRAIANDRRSPSRSSVCSSATPPGRSTAPG